MVQTIFATATRFPCFGGAAQIAPVYYSLGNHEDGATHSWSGRWRNKTAERRLSPKDLQAIADTGAILLDDRFVLRGGFCFGGLSSGLIREGGTPELAWLDDFCAVDAPRILLCHHPEYYERFLRQRNIDLTVSGHAHGGQWRFFGRGVFAPGQGLFPKYTYGVHDGRFVISTGLKVSSIPRFFNWVFISDRYLQVQRMIQFKKHPHVKAQVDVRNKAFDSFDVHFSEHLSPIYSSYESLKIECPKRYDCVITCSDQLWSPSALGSGFYNLNFVGDDILKISWSSSFGVKRIPWYQIRRTRKYLERIEYISMALPLREKMC